LGAAVNVSSLMRGGPLLGVVLDFVGLALCLGYLYVGFRLKQLLMSAPTQIFGLLFATFGLLAAILLLSLLSGAIRETWPTLLIGSLITWYLYANAKRLVAGEPNQAVAQAGSSGGA
jgi:hypothetical protein